MSKKERAGVIPYIRNGDRILVKVMIPSDKHYGGEFPQMAKGRIDDGYDHYSTALKEANEEIGLRAENIVGEVIYLCNHTKIHVYYCEIENMDDIYWDIPHFETGWSGWLDLENVMQFRDIQRPIFQKLYSLLTM